MKTLRSLTSLLLIFSIVISTPAHAERKNNKKADRICDHLERDMEAEMHVCQGRAGNESEVEQCRTDAVHKSTQLNEFCGAHKSFMKARNLNISAASFYTGAAVTCAAACTLAETPWLKAMQVACTVMGLVGAGIDIGGTIHSKKAFEKYNDDTLWVGQEDKRKSDASRRVRGAGAGTTIAGGAAAGMNTLTAVSRASDGMQTANSAQNALCWATFALMTATATLKWTNIGLTAKSLRSTEDAIIALQPVTTEATTIDDGTLTDTSSSTVGGGGPGGAGAFGGSSVTGGDDPFANGDQLLQTMAAASASDEFTDHLNKNGGAFKDLGANLKSLGIDPAAFHAEVQENGPAATLAKLGLSDGAKSLAANIESNTKSAMLADGGVKYGSGGRAPASGGGGGGMDLSGLMGAFGAGGAGGAPAAGAQIATVDFGGSPDNDIWHSKHKGSIFDIVSGKLTKTGARIEKLDYALPMNRALAR